MKIPTKYMSGGCDVQGSHTNYVYVCREEDGLKLG